MARIGGSMGWRVLTGDCVEAMRSLPDASVDSIVTDPPYGLGFMGKEWDTPGRAARATSTSVEKQDGNPFAATRAEYGGASYGGRFLAAMQSFQAWSEEWAREALRVLKPGGHLVAFGGTRTYHRVACAIEDAGFEIRDSLHWFYGSGFPKSLNVSKAIDVSLGAERGPLFDQNGDAVERTRHGGGAPSEKIRQLNPEAKVTPLTAPATPEAARWDGWGTALKPAHEPVVLARKPLDGTVAGTVLAYGTGALNVAECRVGSEPMGGYAVRSSYGSPAGEHFGGGADRDRGFIAGEAAGRWPPNVLFAHAPACSGECVAGCPIAELDAQTGGLSGQSEDTGGASRFFPTFSWDPDLDVPFLYVAKPTRSERDAGLDDLPARSGGEATDRKDGSDGLKSPRAGAGRNGGSRNVHPTVKPVALMEWLVRLVTPKGGTVLDPFLGSGTTGMAALRLGFEFIGIEREEEYVKIAARRLALALNAPRSKSVAELERGGDDVLPGQMALFGGAT